MVVHALSFDVEEWYDGTLYRDIVTPAERPAASRLEAEWMDLLLLLADAGVRATFFVLGEAAERLPDLVRQTAQAGHEIASHGYTHELVSARSPAEVLVDLSRARSLLQRLSGQPVAGFRAPSFSVRRRDGEALAAIARAGHGYSSSIFPFATPLYGDAGAPRQPYRHLVAGGLRLLELPPALGGIYWRVCPACTSVALRLAKRPQVVYLHPWELNPKRVQPISRFSWLGRLGLTCGINGARRQLRRLLRAFRFAPLCEVYSAYPEVSSHDPPYL